MYNISIWEKESFLSPQEVLIVGAGFLGLWTAWELIRKKPSLRITILERNSIPLGASTRNAGFACFGSAGELMQDAATMGADAMLQVTEMRYKGIQKIRQYFTNAQSGFELCGGYECINYQQGSSSTLPDQLSWLNSVLHPVTGVPQTFTVATEKLTAQGLQGFDALIENKLEGSLHSGQLVQMLTHTIQSLGVQILYGMEVSGWQQDGDHITIQAGQYTLQTQQLLFCTNAFTTPLVPGLPVEPARGQVIVTAPMPGLTLKGTFHFEEGFYYWRNIGNRILLGGARNKAFAEEQTTELNTTPTIQQELQSFLEQHFVHKTPLKVDHCWSGIMGFTGNKQPILYPVTDNVWAAVACNGMGVALAPVFAETIAGALIF